jgi:hypothetical protein
MSGPDRQTDRIVRAWLEFGVTQFPDTLLDAVLVELPSVRQRQPFWLARRFATMTTTMRIAVAAVATVAVLSGGFLLLSGGVSMFSGPKIGGPGSTPTPVPSETIAPTPTPTPTPTPDPTPTPAPADMIPFDDVELAAGSYSYYAPVGDRELRVTLTVPAGWIGHESWYVYRERTLSGGPGVAVAPWLNEVDIVYPDPCQRDASVDTGTTAAELAAAFAATPMHVGPDPVDITVSGYTGKELRISTDPAIDEASCGGENIIPWIERGGGSERHVLPGTEQTLWILDVEGNRLVIDASAEPEADDTQRAQLRQVLESVQIEVN